MRRSNFILVSAVLALGVGARPASAVEKRALSIEAIFDGTLSGPALSQMRWAPDGRLSYFLDAGGDRRNLWLFDPARGARRVLVGDEELARLAPSPGQAGLTERERTRRTRYHVPAYHWSPDGRSLLLSSAGQLQLYDLASRSARRLAPSHAGVLDARFSPDGEWVSFVHDHDLWVVPTAGGEPRRLTTGGSDLLLHGDLDWLYPEELGIRRGYEWAPDSGHIVFLELDEHDVPVYPITDLLGSQASVDLQRYPKPGDPNPAARVGIVSVATARTVWMDRSAEYVARIQWVDARTAAVQLLNRGQDQLEIALVDSATGAARSALSETDDHWVDVTDDLRFLGGGREFVWTSHRDGLRHVYLYRIGEGGAQLVRRLTSGDWQVSRIEGLDEEGGWVYFSANKADAIGSDLYRVSLNGGDPERMTAGAGTHQIEMTPGADAFVDRFSSLTDPGRTSYRRVGSIRSFLLQEKPQLDDLNLVTPDGRSWTRSTGPRFRCSCCVPLTSSPANVCRSSATSTGCRAFRPSGTRGAVPSTCSTSSWFSTASSLPGSTTAAPRSGVTSTRWRRTTTSGRWR